MDFLSVLEIIVVVICAITYGFMLFFKVRGNVLGAVSELIALAEASGLTGAEKMSQVVNGLYVKIPAPLKKIFTPERLQSIAPDDFRLDAEVCRRIQGEQRSRRGQDARRGED